LKTAEFGIRSAVAENRLPEARSGEETSDGNERTTDLIFGKRKLVRFSSEILELRARCGQQDDLTTDPRYFLAANALKGRRVAAALIRKNCELEACVFFFEHTMLGVGLGVCRGGGGVGEGLIAGPEAFRVHYVHLATQALLRHWRIHGVVLAIEASLENCLETMGPADMHRVFSVRTTQYKLALERTYGEMLARMGPRTRRSLAKKRHQLETSSSVVFLPSLEPAFALKAMLALQPMALPRRARKFYHARLRLLRERPEFFCMGLRLPDGTWLSVLSGCRRNQVTYIDFQMNDMHFKKESLSAVMRAFMLENEIAHGQKLIHFIGGTSLLLRRYCEPVELCTDAFLRLPGLRARLFSLVIPLLKPESVYERAKTGTVGRMSDYLNAPE
jgi:hypothetical protein